MRRAIFFTLLLSLCSLPQYYGTTLHAQGSVTVIPSEEVELVTNIFLDANEVETLVEGWRVQILATTDRTRLERVESQFKVNYPSIPVDWVHNKPYYKLRAGAFQTKQEAERLKNTLGQQFEGVYLVKANVGERELLRMY